MNVFLFCFIHFLLFSFLLYTIFFNMSRSSEKPYPFHYIAHCYFQTSFLIDFTFDFFLEKKNQLTN
ncbi:hypothetical protein BD560DRAFT_413913 [Blakeslea trispora]|nr:hypothetical protein BD560DRAFT_413913 [Blakeslea trispora]